MAKDKEQTITLSLYLSHEEYDELKEFCWDEGWSVLGMLKQTMAQIQRQIKNKKQKTREELPLTILN
ncbi:TPA: hypothetical protein PXM23_003899 [Yersinia enterocolitica]|nr:hypothetical protein [Yersinia enterocolitica]